MPRGSSIFKPKKRARVKPKAPPKLAIHHVLFKTVKRLRRSYKTWFPADYNNWLKLFRANCTKKTYSPLSLIEDFVANEVFLSREEAVATCTACQTAYELWYGETYVSPRQKMLDNRLKIFIMFQRATVI